MKRILLNRTREEIRAAIINNGELESYFVERDDNPRLLGNIYKGRVENFFPGMQAAFIDIGLEKNAFLQVGRKKQLKTDEQVIIQIEKEAVGTKGPRATLSLSIPGHNLVFLPGLKYIGISRQIHKEEKTRLLEIAKKIRPNNAGIIIRTAAEGCAEEILTREVDQLSKLWKSLEIKIAKRRKPSLLYSSSDLIMKLIRDEFTSDVEEFLIDNLKMYNRAAEAVKYIAPELIDRLELYDDETPIFEKFKLTEEIKSITEREIDLPSGASITIDRTEALTVIDVNTKNFVGNENLSDTVYKTNIEAASMILKQLHLRNIGGIIIVDFIDMPKSSQRESLLAHLREVAKKDKIKTNIVDMTPLGLVEITRRYSRH